MSDVQTIPGEDVKMIGPQVLARAIDISPLAMKTGRSRISEALNKGLFALNCAYSPTCQKKQ